MKLEKNGTIICVIGILLFTGLFHVPCTAGDMAIIKVNYRTASDVLPIVEGILASEGTVTADTHTNSLVVIGQPGAISRVKQYLKRFDRPTEQVRIYVRFSGDRADKARTLSASGSVSGDDWRVSTHGKTEDGVHVQVADGSQKYRSTSDYFVLAASGRPAYIRTATSIPYHGRWVKLTRHHGISAPTVSYQEVDTGFDVTPVIVGNQALLKIVPRISQGDTNTGIIRFHGARTQVRVPLGKWVDLGGVVGQKNDVMREILARGRGENHSSLRMSLKVERYLPPKQ